MPQLATLNRLRDLGELGVLPGSQLAMSSSAVTLSLRRGDDGTVELCIADTGVGIPAEDLPHIFDEFRQVERQGGEQTEGTGLGLAIAKKTVALLGGEISASSEVGEGTRFTIRFRDYGS